MIPVFWLETIPVFWLEMIPDELLHREGILGHRKMPVYPVSELG